MDSCAFMYQATMLKLYAKPVIKVVLLINDRHY